jgi:hypothetical protein
MRIVLAKLALLLGLALHAGCGGHPPAPATATSAVTSTVLATRSAADGSVVVTWVGKPPEVGVSPDTPVGLWINEIAFEFRSDGATLRRPFTFDNGSTTFDIFSPDGRYVALSQGHGEPFHIVAVASLRAYLEGKSTSHEIVTGHKDAKEGAVLAEEPRWTSNETFAFTAICCGTHWTVVHHIGGNTELGEAEPLHPHTQEPDSRDAPSHQ